MKKNKINLCALLPSILLTTSLLLSMPIAIGEITTSNNHTSINKTSTNAAATINQDNVMKVENTKNVRIRWGTPSVDIGNYDFFNNMQSMQPFNYKGGIYSIANNESGGLIVYDSSGNIINSFGSSELVQQTGATFQIIEAVVASSQGSYIYISTLSTYGKTNEDGSYSTFYKWDWSADKLTKIMDFKSHTTNVRDSRIMDVIPGKTEADDKIFGFYSDYSGHGTGRPLVLPYYVVDIKAGTSYDSTIQSVPGVGVYQRPVDMMILKTSDASNPYQIIMFTRAYDNQDFNSANFIKIPFSLNTSGKVVMGSNVSHWQLGAWWMYSIFEEGLQKLILTTNKVSKNLNDLTNVFANTYNCAGYSKSSAKIEDHYLTPSSTSIKSLSAPKGYGFVDAKSKGLHILEQDGSADGKYVYELHSNSNAINSTNPNLDIKLSRTLDDYYDFSDLTSTIKGFTYADVNKSKMLLFDSNDMVSQYDLNTNKYSLVKGIAPINQTTIHYKELSKQSASNITKTDLNELFDIKGLTIDTNKTKLTPNDQLGTLGVSLVAHDKNGNEFTSNETFKGFLTYKTDSAWHVVWMDDSKINKNQYAIKGGVSDADVLKWCQIGALVKPFEIDKPLIKRNQLTGTIIITINFKDLPTDYDGPKIVATHTYTGFKTGAIPATGLSKQDTIIAIAVTSSIVVVFLIGLIVLYFYKRKKKLIYEARKAYKHSGLKISSINSSRKVSKNKKFVKISKYPDVKRTSRPTSHKITGDEISSESKSSKKT